MNQELRDEHGRLWASIRTRRMEVLLASAVLLLLLLPGCDGGYNWNYTLGVEVTSSGAPIKFTGTVTPLHSPSVPISSTTPFSTDIPDNADCGLLHGPLHVPNQPGR